MKPAILLGLVILLVSASGAQAGYETASVARITAPSQLSVIESSPVATFYTKELKGFLSREEKIDSILRGIYPTVRSMFAGNAWTWSNFNNAMESLSNGELLILEAGSEFSGNTLEIKDTAGVRLDAGTSVWSHEFGEYHPFFIFNTQYAGLDLPKTPSFIRGWDTGVIAPTATTDDNFIPYLICSLMKHDSDSIGRAYREARNNYYWTSANPSGIALMSYVLYMNPMAKITMPASNLAACDEFPPAGAAGMEGSGQSMKPGTGAVTVTYNADFSDYEIANAGNFSLVQIEGTMPRNRPFGLVLPEKAIIHEFPLTAIITGISPVAWDNPINLTIGNLPAWDNGLIERACSYEGRPAGFGFSYSYSKDTQFVKITINPIEVADCDLGKVSLYKDVKYRIDYLL